MRGIRAKIGGLTAAAALALAAGALSGPVANAEPLAAGTSHPGGLTRGGAQVLPTAGIAATDARIHTNTVHAASLPTSVDLKQWTVPVGDQSTVNSCVSWAIGYSMLGWYTNYLKAQSVAYAPMFIYSQTHQDGDGGSSSYDAYSTLLSQGIPLQSQYSQGTTDYTTQPTSQEKADAKPNKTTTSVYLYNLENSTKPGSAAKTAIETAIAAKHPVALGLLNYTKLQELSGTGATLTAAALKTDHSYEGGHMVLVVGYDKTGVQIQNSWGTGWGDQGYATLSWGVIENYTFEASWLFGFDSGIKKSVPAAPGGVSLAVTGSKHSALLKWTGTAGYADDANHPVKKFHLAFHLASGGDSVTGNYTQHRGDTNSLAMTFGYPSRKYVLTFTAINSVGTSKAVTFTFVPNKTHTYTAPATSPIGMTMPKPAPRAQVG